jgi:hypothetical protein
MQSEKVLWSEDDRAGAGSEQWTYVYSAVPRAKETVATSKAMGLEPTRREPREEAGSLHVPSKDVHDVHDFHNRNIDNAPYRTPERQTRKPRWEMTTEPREDDRISASASQHHYRQGEQGNLAATHTSASTMKSVAKTPEKGDLDNFLGYKDTSVRGVTIQAAVPSPDKSASTVVRAEAGCSLVRNELERDAFFVFHPPLTFHCLSSQSWSASPDFVAGFPEAQSKIASQKRLQQHQSTSTLPDMGKNHHKDSPTEKQHRFLPSDEITTSINREGPRTSPWGVAETGSTSKSGGGMGDLLRIQIDTPRPCTDDSTHNRTSFTFYVPVSLMLQREIEMQEAARINRIGQERWSNSRIFRMWKKQKLQQQQQQQHHVAAAAATSSAMTILLTPEVSLQNSSSSCSNFRWKSWLTTCIRAFYNTGSLRIPHSCQGDDILLALEYFGILTASSEMFVFESALAFERIQSWSRYFTFRTELAETLLEAYDDAEEGEEQRRKIAGDVDEDAEIDHERARAIFLRSSSKARSWVLVDEQECHSMGNNQVSLYIDGVAAMRLAVRTEGGLYDLFLGAKSETTDANYMDDDEDYESSRRLPLRLRSDFCEYVRQSLPPRTAIKFDLENVEIISPGINSCTRSSKFEIKPVIRIEPDRADLSDSQQKSVKSANIGIEDPESSLRSASMGSGRSRVDAVAASKASSAGTGHRWKTSECSTHQSLRTKTLAGEGISPVSGEVYSGPFPLVQKILFLDETLHQQPHLHDIKGGVSPELNFRIHPRKIAEDPTSPTSIRVHRQDSGLTDVRADVARLGNETSVSKLRSSTEAAPITYINTEYGDLRSVTSMLSEPVIDIPGVVGGMKVTNSRLLEGMQGDAIEKGGEKNMLAEAARRIIQNRTFDEGRTEDRSGKMTRCMNEQVSGVQQPGTSGNSIMGHARGEKLRLNSEHSSEDGAGGPRVGPKEQRARQETLDVKEDSGQRGNDGAIETRPPKSPNDPFASWGHILASVCEAVIPAPPMNDATSSPTQTFSVTAPNGVSAKPLMDRPTEIQDDQPYAGCPCRQDPTTGFDESGTSQWVPTVPDDENERGDYSFVNEATNPDEFLDRARQMGREISSQFDALMKMAFDASGEVRQMRSGILSTIPEEMPEGAIPLSEEKPWEITTKKMQVTVDNYPIPKSQSFESDVLAEAAVPLPPHQPRRARNKVTVARKKNSPNRPSTGKGSRDFHDMHSGTTNGYPVAVRDHSVSSLSEFSSPRVPGQPIDNRKMLT